MKLKLLMVGPFSYYVYEEVLCEALSSSFNIIKYEIDDYSLKSKIFNYRQRNLKFVEFVRSQNPDVLFFYRTNSFLANTIRKLRRDLPELKLVIYHNDNPYVGFANRFKYLFYLSLVPIADIVYCYRRSNFAHAERLGSGNVKLFMPHYCTKIHYRDNRRQDEKVNDVVFIGHYADDGRADFIDLLIKDGVNLKIYGPWTEIAKARGWDSKVVNPSVYNEDYRTAIASSKIALCFLSKKNRDGYTRRCFEIPAIGTLLLSEFTEELSEIFVNGKEIILFHSPEDLLDKVKYYLEHSHLAEQISDNGFRKVQSGFSEYIRADMITNDILKLYEDK